MSREKSFFIPDDVRGVYRNRRVWTQAILVLVFLGLPWVQIGGHQSILLDIPQRRFALFGLVFGAHETPLLFFLLAIGFLGIALVTSLWGRIWCGWGCPQTVFIDFIYRRIESLVEGKPTQRRKQMLEPMTAGKLGRRFLKWFLFFVVSSILAHNFAAYFVGSEQLLKMLFEGPSAHWTTAALVTFLTLIVFFDFAWFRERFCIVVCPYGRFQNVLIEPKTYVIGYDRDRGEPRRGQVIEGKAQGDCVSCQRCVQVCPTGIDIRDGLQLECINCTACIDACNEIMTKVNKPKNLIGYRTVSGAPGKLIQVKSMAYSLLLMICFAGLIYVLKERRDVDVTSLRGTGLPYSTVRNEQGQEMVLNQFRFHLTSQVSRETIFEVELPEVMKNQGFQLVMAERKVKLVSFESKTVHFFVMISSDAFRGKAQIPLQVTLRGLEGSSEIIVRDFDMIGPLK